MATLTGTRPTTARLRAAWSAAHAPVPGVPRWARIAAYAIPFTVLPSAAWRLAAVVFHVPLDGGRADRGAGDVPAWLPMEVYVIILSVVSEVLAFTAVGLIARWGERFPGWLPVLRGRRVPTPAAVIPATVGAVTLTVLWGVSLTLLFAGRTITGEPIPGEGFLTTYDWHFVVLVACYAPLLLWGPLLGAVTVAYGRRRRAAAAPR
ncbi:hypothetical protein [Micromonospora sp. URMC 103]|uniref:hypothetical protein n=1 Tax=Micromonospora sp. URMC 103 TaxID=3423406 RepID=UPI003F1955E8